MENSRQSLLTRTLGGEVRGRLGVSRPGLRRSHLVTRLTVRPSRALNICGLESSSPAMYSREGQAGSEERDIVFVVAIKSLH